MPNLDNTPQNGLGGSSYLYKMGTSPNTRSVISSKIRILTPHYGNNSAIHQMGVVSSISISDSRGTEAQRGIGFGDQIAEQVPGVTEPPSISVERALLYLSSLWQASGYAAGVDGPVRSIKHHRWPFDLEEQIVFSTLADADLGAANVGYQGVSGQFDGGIKRVTFPQVTQDRGITGEAAPGDRRGHSVMITFFEACWWTSTSRSYSKDQGAVMESGECQATDVHDFASAYGEFLATGNDPTIGQLGSIRFGEAIEGARFAQAGGVIGGGGIAANFG